jgi:L-seryl-tRNA(Ser) seleniumtransferase
MLHPLARAVRADKVTLAGLQQVALAYLAGDASAIPFWRMAGLTVTELRERAELVARTVPDAKVVETEAVAGGGALPGLGIPSVGVAIEVPDVNRALAALRADRVVARIEDDRVVCDLRTVSPDADERLGAALRHASA